jgi:hypothetical protein
MTERIPALPPEGNTSFPDVDDPAALEAWVDGIEESSARAVARHALVLDIADAHHQITLLNTRPLPTWESPASRRRAWRLIYAGFILSATFALALAKLDGTSPAHVAVAALLPIGCLVWLFLCAHEVVKAWRYRSLMKSERATQVAVLEARRDAAQAHFNDVDEP